MFNFSPSGEPWNHGSFCISMFLLVYAEFHGELLANRPDRDWAGGLVLQIIDPSPKVYQAEQTCKKRKKPGAKKKRRIKLETYVLIVIYDIFQVLQCKYTLSLGHDVGRGRIKFKHLVVSRLFIDSNGSTKPAYIVHGVRSTPYFIVLRILIPKLGADGFALNPKRKKDPVHMYPCFPDAFCFFPLCGVIGKWMNKSQSEHCSI